MTRNLDDETEQLTSAERAVLDRLASLPRTAQVPPDLWDAVAARIGDARGLPHPPRPEPAHRPRRSRLALQCAAALLLFAGGFFAGRRSSVGESAPPASGTGHPLAAAIDVQRTGSAYVAALASLNRQEDPACRSQGREVALSTLSGAAYEIEKLCAEEEGSPDDRGLRGDRGDRGDRGVRVVPF